MTPSRVGIQGGVVLLGVSLGILASSAYGDPRPGHPSTVYQKSRSFRVPFSINSADQSKRRELQLWVSSDSGLTWKPKDSTTSNRSYFTFEAPQDGEYWLAVRSVDSEGRLHPRSNDLIEPSMKVVVDTKAPALSIKPEDRSASLASLRWEIHEEHPDLETLTFEYQAEGTKEWLPVPKQKTGWNGVATWDSGFAEPIKVRATVTDRAGNHSQVIVKIPGINLDGSMIASNLEPVASDRQAASRSRPAEEPTRGPSTVGRNSPSPRANPPALARTDESADESSRPLLDLSKSAQTQHVMMAKTQDPRVQRSSVSRSQESNSEALAPQVKIRARSTKPVVANNDPTGERPEQAPQARPMAKRPRTLVASSAEIQDEENASLPSADLSPLAVERLSRASEERAIVEEDRLLRDVMPDVDTAKSKSRRKASDPYVGTAGHTASSPAEKPTAPHQDPPPAASPPGDIQTLRVASPRFSLDYEVEDVGPEGAKVVELWVTSNGGKTWSKRGSDPDHRSPYHVDLGREGTFGVSLIVRDQKGRGERPPAPGDLPQMWVEVDSAASAKVKADPEPAASPPRPTGFFRRVFGK